ncbi:citramalate synthase [Alicyclobacillus fructus]|uniref:citramalate synthase n=1 Tax=Alicyclobacillus fructus TaxID=2816082 RepID=UPI001A8F10AC|nr:citramalate synthase [Alicyclobacillus fructus]
MSYVYLLDTTLRDGTQGEGISLTVADKIKIAEKLDDLGVAYIEGGFPGANPKDEEFFRVAQSLRLKHAKLTAFGSTRRPGVRVEDDAGVRALLEASTPAVAIVGKAWDFHVTDALRIDLDENLAMISDTVQYLKRHGREVIFDAEHFFDGFKRNRSYALATVRAAWEAGVDWVALCDTNGGSMPHEIRDIVAQVIQEVPVQVGIHTHNDCELAVANSLAAVQAGARMVHGTINGIGERCGNANLASIIPNLELKLGYRCLPSPDHLRQLTPVARFVGEVCNLVAHSYQPFVGHSAFAHKGGIHVSAIQRNPETYEHIPPELVGNERRVLLSELSGVSNVLAQAEAFGIPTEGREAELRRLLERIKQMEHVGYQFEGAEASQELLFRRVLNDFTPPFNVLSVRVDTDVQRQGEATSQAIIKLEVDGEIVHTVSEGNGPVNALDAVLRKALAPHRPEIRRMHLTDYKVRVLDEKDATAARVRVLIESTDGDHVWRTVGVSENVIAASWEALVDSIQYYLALVVPSRTLVEA